MLRSQLEVGLCIAGLFAGAALAAPPTYRVVELNIQKQDGDNPDPYSMAIAKGPWVAVHINIWSHASRSVRCGPDNVCDSFSVFSSSPSGINRHGTMVGTMSIRDRVPSSGYLFDRKGKLTTIPTLNQDCPTSTLWLNADAINDEGQVTGSAEDCDHVQHPISYANGRTKVRAKPPGTQSAYPNGINIHGVIVGTAWTTEGINKGFVIRGKSAQLIGTPGGLRSTAAAVNKKGVVAGCEEDQPDGDYKPFLWDRDNGMVALPTLGEGYMCPDDINDKGDVVGKYVPPSGPGQAFLYSEGQVYKLVDLLQESDRDKFDVWEATGITRDGHISASVWLRAKQERHAVRLERVVD